MSFFPARLKRYPTKKIYLFTGMGPEIIQNKTDTGSAVDLRFINGMGFQPQSNMEVELLHNFNLTQNGKGAYTTPNNLSLKGKYRF